MTPKSPYRKKKSIQRFIGQCVALFALASFSGYGGTTPIASTDSDYIGGTISEAVAGLNGVYTGPNAAASTGVHIHWNHGGYGNVNPNAVICYNIYRDNQTPNRGANSGGALVGPALSVGPTTYDAFDSCSARQVTYGYADLSGNGSDTGLAASIGTLKSTTESVSGVTIGVPHTYYVTTVYYASDPITHVRGVAETPLSSGTAEGFATPAYVVDITNGTETQINGAPANHAAKVDLGSVVFQFLSSPGNDNYVIDIATDSTFSRKLTITSPQSYGISGGVIVDTSALDIRTKFQGVRSFVFRIGGRNSEDVPGPSKNPAYTGDISSPDINPNGGSYIYGADGTFSGT